MNDFIDIFIQNYRLSFSQAFITVVTLPGQGCSYTAIKINVISVTVI